MEGEVRGADQHPHRRPQEGRLQDLRDGRLSLQGGWESSMPAQANAANSECRDRRNLSKKLPGSRFDREGSVHGDWLKPVCLSCLKATSAATLANACQLTTNSRQAFCCNAESAKSAALGTTALSKTCTSAQICSARTPFGVPTLPRPLYIASPQIK